MAIEALGALGALQPTLTPPTVGAETTSGGAAFAQTLENAVQRVDELQHSADDSLRMLASGENVDLHGTMIALEKADISLRAMVSVRDKLVGAYEQVMNMAL